MISITSVTKRFGSVTAVDNVSYTINKGEYFALLGPNGAGKTTIVRMLLGFSSPNKGTITIDGIPVSKAVARKDIGFLAEHLRIPPYLSGKEYLRRHAALIGLTGADAVREVDRILETVGMTGKAKKNASTYSKGMTQRIGLGAAILGKPKLCILDEPVSGLDPIGIRDFRKILEELRQHDLTVVLNSHLLSEVEKTCDSAAIMHKGEIIVKDSIDAIVQENESLEEVFIRYIESKNA
jgi:ABC-2 type transport system ATP-binding protein